MIGFSANRRGGRLPSFILIVLLVIIVILSFNYWSVSTKHGRLLDEVAEMQTQVKRTDAARSRLEKRNSELMMQVDTHRKQIDQKDGDYSVLESKLQARDALVKVCTDEKNKLQNDVSAQMSEIHRLKEQVKELRQEVIRQEDQLREVRKNSTNLEKKLEYESLQCGRQIAELKAEYEESKKRVEEEAAKLRQSLLENRKVDPGGRKLEADLDQPIKKKEEDTAERHTVAARRNDGPVLKDDLGKPGSDAGMPGIEDSEVGKIEDAQFALKKPAITPQKHMEPAEAAALLKEERAGFGAGAGARPGDDLARGQPLDRPDMPHDENLHLGNNDVPVQQQVPKPVADKPLLFDKDNKAGIKADEFGEQRRQLGAEGLKAEGVGLPPPPNPAQVLPKPIDPHNGRDHAPADIPRHRQSRFFDENESPVDPQHGNKLADYNGDDGNVGEYEADKQAELAYNEEEDGDGGEEDVQDDEDREAPGERAVDYGKRHQAIDVL
ncbi:protein CASC4 isoform X1 [Sinocyclocheilus rhinocerous]|uniref:Protein GOLM2 n=1 Tax=Sinocyclocheilus rhinocerous TaxID=307959 RepID=A0A673JX67_9TELE|nr:PREDICTED: protein CASC4-like isoform X1 [Sinocyclocheilus rhinocerous]